MNRKRKKPKLARIAVKDLTPGPLVHAELPAEQVETLRIIYRKLEDCLPAEAKPFEIFEIGFLRDLTPAREIGIWSAITMAHWLYCECHPEADRKDVLGRLVCISTGGMPDSSEYSKELLHAYRLVHEKRKK